MSRIKVTDGTVKANDIKLERLEIVVDSAYPDKVELYMLDRSGDRIEGGQFDRNAFMDVVLRFYRENF